MDVDDREAVEAFCRREHPRLVGALTLYCGDRAVAEDLAQEALVRAVAAWPRLAAMEAPGPYVHRVGMNLANSRFRRAAAEYRANRRHAVTGSDRHEDPDVAAGLAVRQAVARLPRGQRQVLVLRYYLGVPLAETAATLGLSSAAAASLTYRALARLRQELGEQVTAPAGGGQDVR